MNKSFHVFNHSEQVKTQGRSLESLYRDLFKSALTSVTSFSSHTSGARGLKIGMHNSYMNGSKDI